jgi:CheY-like chemotaxis protein
MPYEDGLSMMRKIRQRAPEHGGQVPALALSAYARAEDRQAALEAGFNRFLSKPAMPADIVNAVAELLPHAPSSTPDRRKRARMAPART